jgi:hypothetical protein
MSCASVSPAGDHHKPQTTPCTYPHGTAVLGDYWADVYTPTSTVPIVTSLCAHTHQCTVGLRQYLRPVRLTARPVFFPDACTHQLFDVYSPNTLCVHRTSRTQLSVCMSWMLNFVNAHTTRAGVYIRSIAAESDDFVPHGCMPTRINIIPEIRYEYVRNAYIHRKHISRRNGSTLCTGSVRSQVCTVRQCAYMHTHGPAIEIITSAPGRWSCTHTSHHVKTGLGGALNFCTAMYGVRGTSRENTHLDMIH